MKAFAIRERSLDPRHPKTVLTLRLLADLYFRQSQFAKAEPLYRLLLDIKENELGKAHPDLVTLNWTLAGIYSEQKKYPEALSLYETLIAQFEEQVGPESSQLIPVLTSYAYVLQLSGKGSEAKRVKKRIRELSPEPDPLPPATPKRPRPQKSTPLTAPA
jgi:tetratricopeptide (TPR) repeat protein